MNKRILFFIGSMNWGGAEKVVSVLANSFAKEGNEVKIVTLLSNENVFQLDSRIKMISLANKEKKYVKNIGYWINGIKQIIEIEQPTTIVSFVCRINLLVLLAYRKSKHSCRLVISERNDPRFDTRGAIARVLCKRLYKKADLLICQTNEEKNYFPKSIQSKSVVIANPVFLNAVPTEFSKKEKVIINVARFDDSKNQMLLIEAFLEILSDKKDNGFVLHLYGSGSLRDELRHFVTENGAEKYISVFDATSDVQQRVSKSSIFCLSSNYEGMSNALMESLLLGTPAISTNTSGAFDLIIEGKNGFVVPINDRDQLKNRLEQLIESENLRKEMHSYCLSREYQSRFANSLELYIKSILGD